MSTVEEVKVFCENNNLPEEMRVTVREYFMQRKHVRQVVRAFEVTRQMSGALQTQVVYMCYGSWMSKISFMKGCEKNCLVQVRARMKHLIVTRNLMASAHAACA